MRIAILDIGTNTVLLLVVESANGELRVLRDDHAIARLGEGVDRTKTISDEAYARFRDVLQKHNETIRTLNVQRVVAVGTSALRDALNREAIVRRTKEDTGIDIEIISGEEEARWSYEGALFGMTPPPSIAPQENADVCVIDIGGGSTEISFGDGRTFQHGVSLDIGAVRLTERFFRTSPITPQAAEEARNVIRAALDHPSARTFFGGRIQALVAVAGTPTTLAAMHQGLGEFDAAKVQNYLLRREAIDQLLDILLKTDTAKVLEHFPVVNKARADILPAGTLILREAMEFLGAEEIRVSVHGLRYGIAMRESE